MQQYLTYTVNVAKKITYKSGAGDDKRYSHYMRCTLGTFNEEEAIALTRDIASRFSEPEFRVDLMSEHCRGKTLKYKE